VQEDRNHLGEGDLAKLLEEGRQLPGPMVDTEQIHPHFATCTDCRQKFEVLVAFDRQLRSSMHGQSTPQPSDCPKQEVWREVAAGVAPADWTRVWIEHAGGCNHCGPLLRGAVAELSNLRGEITDAERKQIAALNSANLQWQQRLGQRIAGTTQAAASRESLWWKQWLSAPRMVAVGISVVALVVAGSWFVAHRKQPAVADQLLARAYTEKRTLELRIAGASYAPLRVSLGPTASFTSRPPALLKAEAMIASQLASRPSDPAWLQAKAKADVLEGKYDAAVEALRRALELQPHSPALLTDLATAYFQRAQQEDRKEDFGAAYEYLSQALQAQPDDPIALFNRAIVAEHQFLYQQALEDWEHYLRVDSGSPWAEEARNRANAIRAKLKEHAEKTRPLLSPAELVAASTSQESEVDERVEEYLHEAVRSWLPQAFP
jgi:tetratricopeptide (TPR) repeat protein